MNTWRYAATDLLTGQLLVDSLPLDVQNFSQQINGGGSLNCSLTLSAVGAVDVPFLTALDSGRAVVWALKDQNPVWAGINLDSGHTSIEQGTVPYTGQTLDVLWGSRLITDTITYNSVDLLTAFLDLAKYGLDKQSSYITTGGERSAAYLSMFASAGRVARLNIPPATKSGVAWTATYNASDLNQISSAWSTMASSGNLEYAFVPGRDANGDLQVTLQAAYGQLGRPLHESGIVLTCPGPVTDYGWTVTRSQGSNLVWATASANGSASQWQSQYPHGADTADLAIAPVMESTTSWQGSTVTAQSQIDGYADGQVQALTAGMTTPTLVLAGGVYPRLEDLQLGDGVKLALTSTRHPAGPNGEPGIQQEVRITGWSCVPSSSGQPEQLTLNTSAVVAAA